MGRLKMDNGGGGGEDASSEYLIVRPEKGRLFDVVRLLVSPREVHRFIESSSSGPIYVDHRWVIIVSIIVRRIISFFSKPMEWTGFAVEFLLNLLSENGNLIGLLLNLIKGKGLVMPRRGSDTFISAIGHLDDRLDLSEGDSFINIGEGIGDPVEGIGGRATMDLCMMASKLAYENANVVRNVVTHRWKMHFVDFYNCWDDYQKESSTQVFIMCDKPVDASLVLISFRGTEPFDADDWSTDFDYSWYEIPKLGKVHMGFLEALGLGSRTNAATFQDNLQPGMHPSKTAASEAPMLASDDLRTAYYTVRGKLKILLDEHPNARFLVTGHSLGGALAILFPAVLLLHEEMEVMKRLLGVYTFGQPRVGDRQLEKFMEAHVSLPVPKYFRVVYCNDLVPRLPYDDKMFLYKHFGLCLYYDSFYVEQNMQEEPNRNYFALKYLIPKHLNSVWEFIRGLTIGYIEGPEYKEGWFSMQVRMVGLVIPGLSAHSPTDYVNCVRLGRSRRVQMASI